MTLLKSSDQKDFVLSMGPNLSRGRDFFACVSEVVNPTAVSTGEPAEELELEQTEVALNLEPEPLPAHGDDECRTEKRVQQSRPPMGTVFVCDESCTRGEARDTCHGPEDRG